MSQVRLNLQPPPNVDFVTGYPGIPPGPDRPQASVKGAIEVRVPTQGVKAKWLRIELRKVETLPGGGAANTFYDFVGPSPVNLWSTSDEYSLLRSQDFPFSIRIPESIPPTISLENRAGIGYELVASVCTKGKKGFLRKAKSVVSSVVSPIIIDKHELHSTWPVYCQPETRHLAQEGVNLIVERSRTCFGPGDRIVVVATVKSDNLHTVILRGFEISLKEATVFRAGIHTPGKKNAPQVKQVNISENKVAVNATLYGGTSHTTELSCMISPHHTTTTLNAARHIDVTYTLSIKALMGTGTHVVMDLPIIMSNWQREVSFEAISRIGPAPSLSLIPASQIGTAAPISVSTRADPIRGRPADAVAATLPTNRANLDSVYGHVRNSSANVFNSLPGASSSTSKSLADELGYGAGYGIGRAGNGLADEFGSTRPTFSTNSSTVGATTMPTATTPVATSSSTTSGRRPGSSGAGNRFTITNAQPQEIPQETPARQRNAQPTGSGADSAGAPRQWPTAEEEKLRLYEKARAQVAKVQGVAASPPPATLRASPPPRSVTASPPRGANTSTSGQNAAWLSAEEEKLRLFQQAQAAVQRTHAMQGLQTQTPLPASAATHNRNDSDPKSSGSGSKPSAAAALYAQAINAQNRSGSGSGSGQAGGGSSTAHPPKTTAPVPQYLTAEQEKAALRRYEDAKRAVDRTQNAGYVPEDTIPPASHSAPIAYESLFPAAARAAPTASSSGPGDAPPSFDSAAGGSNIMAHLSEKERLRRAYEAQDAAALARQRTPPPAAYSAPPPAPAPAPTTTPAPPTVGQYTNALEEKEALRRKFEARDNAQIARTNTPPQPPPPRSGSVGAGAGNPPAFNADNEGSSSPGRSPGANATGFRPTPVPPTSGSGSSRVLTAAEEKALLRAKYEARDSGNNRKPSHPITNGGSATTNGISTATPSTPSPPPLMPRPPVEYIKETQEEDARVSRLNEGLLVLDDSAPKLNGSSSSASLNKPPSGSAALDMKPFTPFRAAFDVPTVIPGPPPPLPPKLAGE